MPSAVYAHALPIMARSKTMIVWLLFFSSQIVSGFVAADDVTRQNNIVGPPIAQGQFHNLREPSGITALDEQTLIVIEDEASRALQRLAVTSRTNSDSDLAGFTFEEFDQPNAKGFIQRRLLAPLDDLEGIARVSSSQFFIIGSHENASRGKHPNREKFALLTRDGNDIVSAAMRRDFFDQLIVHYPVLADIVDGSKKGKPRALNIEALAFDRKRQTLLIGLRTPLLDNKSIVVSLGNAIAYAQGAEPEFANALHIINLEKQGIRAMAYDDQSDKLVIVGKRESGSKKRSTLWIMAAALDSAPQRQTHDDKDLFRDVEGLTPLGGGLLFVRDSGNKPKKDNNHWFILKRSQLGLDR